MDLSAIFARIATIQRGISGVKAAHNKMPERLDVVPAFVNFYIGADVQTPRLPSQRILEHRIGMRLHVSRTDSGIAEESIRSFIVPVLDAFDADTRLSGTCNWALITGFQLGAFDFAGVLYAGVEFTLRVNIREVKTYA